MGGESLGIGEEGEREDGRESGDGRGGRGRGDGWGDRRVG